MILMLQSYPFPLLLAGRKLLLKYYAVSKKLLAYIVHPTIPFTFAEKKKIWKSK